MEGNNKDQNTGDEKWIQPKGLFVFGAGHQPQGTSVFSASQFSQAKLQAPSSSTTISSQHPEPYSIFVVSGVDNQFSQVTKRPSRQFRLTEEAKKDCMRTDKKLIQEIEWGGIVRESGVEEEERLDIYEFEEEPEDPGTESSEREEQVEVTTAEQNKEVRYSRHIPDHIEVYNQDGEITLTEYEGEKRNECSSDSEASTITIGGSASFSNSLMDPRPIFKPGNNSKMRSTQHPCQFIPAAADVLNMQVAQLEPEEDWEEDSLERNNFMSWTTSRSRKRTLPSPILRDNDFVSDPLYHIPVEQGQELGYTQDILENEGNQLHIPSYKMVEMFFENDVLLVPGLNECTVGNMEMILDCMKNCCGPSQQFRMVESLEIALRKCRPGCRIFVGCGEHPISSLGVLGSSGGQISGPHSGYGQAVISPNTFDHVWLNVMRSSEISMENVTILLDKINMSTYLKNSSSNGGPSVGFLVQGSLRLHNVIITTKLNDCAENPSRAITGIELTEQASLVLQRSTIKHCSIGLITQNDVETEINEATITNCVIGFQSAALAKNYIKDLTILHANNYAVMVDSESQYGEGTVENLKQEESFFIENLKIKDCSTEVYFVEVDPQRSSNSSSGSDPVESLNKTA